LLLGNFAPAQEHNLSYAIHRDDKKVGELVSQQTKESNKTIYSIKSLVNVSMVLSFRIQAWEKFVYENNVLQSSFKPK
jgi:hypothetical protein